MIINFCIECGGNGFCKSWFIFVKQLALGLLNCFLASPLKKENKMKLKSVNFVFY